MCVFKLLELSTYFRFSSAAEFTWWPESLIVLSPPQHNLGVLAALGI